MDVPDVYSVMPIIQNYGIKQKSSLSFSNFNRKDLINELIKSFQETDYEKSLHLGIELHISGCYKDLISQIIDFYINYSLVNNPEFALFIADYLNKLDIIIKQIGKTDFKSRFINSQETRNIFASLIIEVNDLTKDNAPIHKRIMDTMDKTKFEKAKENTIEHVESFHKYTGNSSLEEIKYALNEILYAMKCILHRMPWKYNLTDDVNPKHFSNPLSYFDFWITWLLQWEKYISKNGMEKRYVRDTLTFNKDFYKINVPKNGWNHWIWFLWNFLMINIERNHGIDRFYFQLAKAFLIISRYRFTWSKAKSRVSILRFLLNFIYENREITYKKNYTPLSVFAQLNINILYQSFVPSSLESSNLEQYHKTQTKVLKAIKNEKENKKKNDLFKQNLKILQVNKLDEMLLHKKSVNN